MMPPSPVELAERQLEAYNRRNIEAFVENFSDDVECFALSDPSNAKIKGIAQFLETYSKMFEASPNLHCKILSRQALGNFVLDHEEVAGLPGVDGLVHIVAIYQVEGRVIRRVYFTR